MTPPQRFPPRCSARAPGRLCYHRRAMVGSPSPQGLQDRRGYAGAGYAASQTHLGRPLRLPASGAHLIVRPIPGSELADGSGPYPLFDCEEWAALAGDLRSLEAELVSVVCVPDPLRAPVQALAEAFPDLLRPFKHHRVVELDGDWRAGVSPHHARAARRGRRKLAIERVVDPSEALGDWCDLYDNLLQRQTVGAAAHFSRLGFARQLALPQLCAYRARLAERTVGMSLFVRRGNAVHYHLSAADELGRRNEAGYALLERALGDFEELGLERVDLGGAAGLHEDPTDGLAAFKDGWTRSRITAMLAGRILDRAAYADLAGEQACGDFFPAYRGGLR